eukprot:CAMPEP_0197289338 /NCGR_PEP_ID=MMETSP0890-20130614/6584_1 /TAXON_ID=44058 ORGANISM="Aureoumbra lagunensis, Strain CCMP1510" /NCGR_SAMPLE_ID=MMETSP0890 /ASSEMBLY_ACC=CAM_ASM_000533 /LENGTH=654 /DNA_ID=CAMNT_0042760685 /DNA_START=10 /DNA_END=1974 /DNA_ORIENTATION=+
MIFILIIALSKVTVGFYHSSSKVILGREISILQLFNRQELRRGRSSIILRGEKRIEELERREWWAMSELFEEFEAARVKRVRFVSDHMLHAQDSQGLWHRVSILGRGTEDLILNAINKYNIEYMIERRQSYPSLINLLPIGFLGWIFWRRNRAKNEDPSSPMQLLQARTMVDFKDTSNTTFAHVAGCDQAKFELSEVVDFLKNPSKYQKLGARPPGGVLLEGPPGTGKTLLARAVAGEAGVPFISTSGSQFVEMFVGVGASRIRDLFQQAKKKAPSIIFIDELDAIGRQRSGASAGFAANDEREATLNQILTEMDGFHGHSGVIVLAATNRPEILDAALLRPGRFDRRVLLENPDLEGRLAILTVHAQGKQFEPDVELRDLAVKTVGCSGALLKTILNEAAIHAARRGARAITRKDLDRALDRVTLGLPKSNALFTSSPAARALCAYHEAGHALVGTLMPGFDPIEKVSLVQTTGRSELGATVFRSVDDDHHADTGSFGHYSFTYLCSLLATTLAGRVAEEIVFGYDEVTTGSANDLQKARTLARNMVQRWGFADEAIHSLNPAPTAWLPDETSPELYAFRRHFASPQTETFLDQAVAALIKHAYRSCRSILIKERPFLNVVAEALLEYETIDAITFNDLRNKYLSSSFAIAAP